MLRTHRVLLAIVLATTFLAAPAVAGDWQSLFDGKTLGRWQVVDRFDFIQHGEVAVDDGCLVLRRGRPGTAARYAGRFPKANYEIELEARRVAGSDFFCGLTFPVGEEALSLICGGWGGSITGLSCIDGEPAAENETAGHREFENGRWYKIRLRVTDTKIEAWIDQRQIVDFKRAGRKLSIWFEPETALPLGIATWETTGAIRRIRFREIDRR